MCLSVSSNPFSINSLSVVYRTHLSNITHAVHMDCSDEESDDDWSAKTITLLSVIVFGWMLTTGCVLAPMAVLEF